MAEVGRLILSDINLNVRYGTTLSIIGPSGSGKSTLLNIMGTLDRPSGGDVLLEEEQQMNDRQAGADSQSEDRFHLQAHHLLPQCGAECWFPHWCRGGCPGRAHRLLERWDWRNVCITVRVSRRRTATGCICSGTDKQPSLILADEPTGALDQVNAKRLMQLLIDLNREEGVTLIVVTHAPDLAQNLEHLMQLEKGQLVRVEKVHS